MVAAVIRPGPDRVPPVIPAVAGTGEAACKAVAEPLAVVVAGMAAEAVAGCTAAVCMAAVLLPAVALQAEPAECMGANL